MTFRQEFTSGGNDQLELEVTLQPFLFHHILPETNSSPAFQMVVKKGSGFLFGLLKAEVRPGRTLAVRFEGRGWLPCLGVWLSNPPVHTDLHQDDMMFVGVGDPQLTLNPFNWVIVGCFETSQKYDPHPPKTNAEYAPEN